jgi:hypothetical protein
MKTMPRKDTRLTIVTDARIAVRSAMSSTFHGESTVLFLAVRGYVLKEAEKHA